jgi:prophage regulatory protein
MGETMRVVPASGEIGRLLRRREVEREVGLSRSSIYDYMRRGAFPRPINIAPHTVRWIASEIEAWKAGKSATNQRRN